MNSDLIIYEKSDLSGNGITLFSYPISNIEDDALFIVNGKFTLSSSGHVGGKIKHTNNGGSTVDFSSCSDANLSVSSIEGGNAKEIVKQSIALFKVNSNYKEILIGSSQIITSSYENNNYYWNGKFNLTIQISIVLSVSYTYNVYFYTIYTADDSSGTNKSAISAIDSKDIKTVKDACVLMADATGMTVGDYKNCVIMLNGRQIKPSSKLSDGDELVFLAPSGGG